MQRKIATWINSTTKVNFYDTTQNKSFSFNVSIPIPNDACGIMSSDRLYVMGGSGPIKSTYEIDGTSK